jgi:hypothetical protein
MLKIWLLIYTWEHDQLEYTYPRGLDYLVEGLFIDTSYVDFAPINDGTR